MNATGATTECGLAAKFALGRQRKATTTTTRGAMYDKCGNKIRVLATELACINWNILHLPLILKENIQLAL